MINIANLSFNEREIRRQAEDEILDLIYHYNDITTSDLQGIVTVLVSKIREATSCVPEGAETAGPICFRKGE